MALRVVFDAMAAASSRSADLVLTTARDLSDQAANLRASVDRFLANVAA